MDVKLERLDPDSRLSRLVVSLDNVHPTGRPGALQRGKMRSTQSRTVRSRPELNATHGRADASSPVENFVLPARIALGSRPPGPLEHDPKFTALAALTQWLANRPAVPSDPAHSASSTAAVAPVGWCPVRRSPHADRSLLALQGRQFSRGERETGKAMARGLISSSVYGSQFSGTLDRPLQKFSRAVRTGKADCLKDLLSDRTPWIGLDGLQQSAPVGPGAPLHSREDPLERPALHWVVRGRANIAELEGGSHCTISTATDRQISVTFFQSVDSVPSRAERSATITVGGGGMLDPLVYRDVAAACCGERAAVPVVVALPQPPAGQPGPPTPPTPPPQPQPNPPQ